MLTSFGEWDDYRYFIPELTKINKQSCQCTASTSAACAGENPSGWHAWATPSEQGEIHVIIFAYNPFGDSCIIAH
jgi:hypothetical protein